MTEVKFVGKTLPGRDRQTDMEIESVLTQIKRRPGEWAEIKRSPITSRHSHVIQAFQKHGAEGKTRQNKATGEIVYYIRWPEGGNGSA